MPALISAVMAGWRRSLSRQRRRVGPMLPAGMPSLALISVYGTGGSAVSRASSCWQPGGSCPDASRSAACGRVAQAVQVVHEGEPDGLGGVLGVGGLQSVPAADGPDQRGVPVHQLVPGLGTTPFPANVLAGMRRVVRCEAVSYREWSPQELLEFSLAADDPASISPAWRA